MDKKKQTSKKSKDKKKRSKSSSNNNKSIKSARSSRGVLTLKQINKSKQLSFITELDLFKLAAINLPRHVLIKAMPITMQLDSIEINRIRSNYIKVMI